MTIEISKPELEALIRERMQAQEFLTIEDMLWDALSTGDQTDKSMRPQASGRKSLAQLFAESPLKGLDLKFERDTDTGRYVEL